MNDSFYSRLSIRGKMTLAALLPLGVILLVVTVAAFSLINAWVVDQAQRRVRQDLSAAREVLGHEEDHLRNVLRFSSHASPLVQALALRRPQMAAEELETVRKREGLDLLTLTDARGEVLLRAASSSVADPPPPLQALVAEALSGDAVCRPALLEPEGMVREGEDLAARARVPLRSPLTLRPEAENRGMFLLCAAPVADSKGRRLGALYGGILLNGNLGLVDRIKEVVYGEGAYEGQAMGSATLFLEDLRVATTVRLRDGERAMGTLVSKEVAEAVLKEKKTWLDRARVVDEWYLTAYEPILNGEGEAIGALYVGLLEHPFRDLKVKASLILVALLLLGGGLGYLLARTASDRLSRPLLRLEATAQRVAEGERDILLPVTTGDEVGHLTETFNRMTSALREKEDELHGLNRGLERKVEERTAQLEEKSLQLIRAQEELLRSEKLAAIGSLAAGVAHEINNPAAIIRGNVEILLSGLPAGAEGQEEAEEILRQTDRISYITQNMLAFARERALHPERVQVNRLLEEILAQINHQVPLGNVSVRRDLDPALPEMEGDRERLRQVFTNILLNALQAMAGKGRLTVTTQTAGKGEVTVSIADTGPGIPSAIREKIFNPFFTTRECGTGLGLSVSYGIVQALKGSIEVESEEGEGTIFRIHLPTRS